MTLHQARITIAGFVGKNPIRIGQEGSTPVCSFRIASADGYFDGKAGTWRELPTTWLTVKAFKSLANNVLRSVHKGDPVLVTGSLVTQEWAKDGSIKSSLILEADSLGHDLNLGVSHFQRLKIADNSVEQKASEAGSDAF
ncbi:single-stranded DNA-binding protein [Bombiscardovia coagulans]|uniref:Single-stranded DNA-binding protein n=1 Tax=Bombiscardovia coagulans TaxID=686666 RepID=A0A261ETJ7_9BIFI|nr:single-stranded DNA-binding protein [Bombiscardovia coagulans]OZG50178.1 single-strand DNA binding protein [Bombiscardovia coagulans]